LSLNLKKLALSAAVAGGVICPTLTGNWHLISKAGSAFDEARGRQAMLQAEESFFATRNITREEFYKDEEKKCKEYTYNGQYNFDKQKHDKDSTGFWRLFPPSPSDINGDCGIVSGNGFVLPKDNAGSYLAGLTALVSTIVPLGVSISFGALVASLIVGFGPRAVGRYFRWLQTS
jgi:hypothetical protein